MSLDKDNNKHRGYTADSKLNPSDDSLEGRWSNIQADYRKKNPSITDDDVNFKSGEFDHMIASIARRTNRSAEDIKNDIRNWNM
jgi:predicted nucleic acid-binding protein